MYFQEVLMCSAPLSNKKFTAFSMATLGILILSVVLASSLESYFRQSLMLSKGSYMIFLTRPVSLVILLIIVGTAIFSVVNNQIKKKKKAASKA